MEKGGKMALMLGAGCLGFIILGLVGIGTCTLCAGHAVSSGMEQMEAEEQAQDQAAQTQEGQVPWLAQVRDTCTKYDSAPNDIQKSKIFNENQGFVKGKVVSGIKGELVGASTGHGGGSLILTAKLGKAEFVQYSVSDSSPLYAKAANLVIGQCIVFGGTVSDTVFSGGLLEPAEKSRICKMRYSFNFDSIEACPPQ